MRCDRRDPPPIHPGDAVDLLPLLVAQSTPEVVTVVIAAGVINQLADTQRLRFMGRLATLGQSQPIVLLSSSGGHPKPLSTWWMLTEAAWTPTPRTYAHSDQLGERAAWHGPIEVSEPRRGPGRGPS